MTDAFDAELAELAGEVAELLRFEHDAGAIGVWVEEPAIAAPPPARPAVAGPRAPRQEGAPGAPRVSAEMSTPRQPPAALVMPEREAAAPVARATEATFADVDALLAQAKRARTTSPTPVTSPSAPSVEPTAHASTQATAADLTTTPSTHARLQVLSALAEEAAGCTACRLHETRTKSVFARGSAETELVFVGEGPGFNEDKRGEPFVGAAGQLLDKMVGAMGFARDAVYICNVVKCRPPENRTPLEDEAAACGRFLEGQLAAVAPRVIVALGRSAAARLGCVEEGRSWRGAWGMYGEVPVMPTYHPAYLLRNPEMKRAVWEDLQKVTAKLRGGAT